MQIPVLSVWVSRKQLWQIQKFQLNEISFTPVSVLPSQFFRLFLIFSCSAPALHVKQPVQLREVTRVKEFPAGNAAHKHFEDCFLARSLQVASFCVVARFGSICGVQFPSDDG